MSDTPIETFARPDDFGELKASELKSSMGERLGAQANEAFMGGMRTLTRIREYQHAEHGDFSLAGQVGRIRERIAAGDDPDQVASSAAAESANRTYTPTELPTTEAQARIKQEGLEHHIKLPDQATIKQPVLDLMIQHAHERRQTEAAISRGPQGFLPDALGFITEMGVGIIDPINIAAFSIPVMGEARMGMMLSNAGSSIAKRAAVNAAIGGAQGAVGGALLVPGDWWLHTKDGVDYTMSDALRSVVLSAGMGGAFHAAGGAIGDVRARMRGRPLAGSPEEQLTRALTTEPAPEQVGGVEPAEEVPGITQAGLPPHPAEILADLPDRVREDVTRASIADVINGNAVRAGELLEEAAKADPRIAESVHGPATVLRGPPAARGPRARDENTWSLLEFLASRGGIRPEDANIGDVHSILGTSNKFVPGFGHLVRKGGMRLDQAREAATEAGYLRGEMTGGESIRLNDLLEAIDTEARGSKVYRAGSERAQGANRDQMLHDMEREFDAQLEEVGLKPKDVADSTRARVLQIMDKEHVADPLIAYERAVMEETERGAQTGQHQRVEDHIPGWDVPDDAGATSPTGRALTRGGQSPAGEATRGPGAGDRGPDWQRLADRAVDRSGESDLTEASHEAAATPEPASIDIKKAPSAAEAAAKEADQLLADILPKLSEKERAVFEEGLAKLKQDKAAQEQMVREGAECLARAIA